MSQTYFLKTVPEIIDSSLSLSEKLEITVHNTGNYFFEHAVEKQIKNYTLLNEINDIQEDDSTLILSMSNFISPSTDLGEVAENIEKKKIAKVVMIGAGAQAYDYDERPSLTKGTKRFLDILSERSASIGVRGTYTANVLNDIGIKNVDIIGCPSIFFHADPKFKVMPRKFNLDEKIKTVFHFTPVGYYRDKVSNLLSFGIRNCEAYIAQSENFLLGFNQETEENLKNLKFFFHYYNDGTVTVEEAKEWFRKNIKWFFSLNEWLAHMENIDFSMGARFHGNMAAILMGKPALNMVFDTRTRELVEYLNLPYIHLKDFSPKICLHELYASTSFDLFNQTFVKKYQAYRNFLIKNGLETSLPDASNEIFCAERCAKDSMHILLDDLLDTGYINKNLTHELNLRIERFRSEKDMLTAESTGKI